MLALALIWAAPAWAEPPAGADPDLAPWFQGLKQPGTTISCCSIADCRTVVTRERDGHIEAFVPRRDFPAGIDAWVTVPDARVLRGEANPTGEPVLCWAGEVRCFVPAGGF